ncbi:MAG: AraC family transcriptional regulator [Acidobacteriota bacterium]|nr:AraC family transcriptional regulator [Acidobacteriota bacterium]
MRARPRRVPVRPDVLTPAAASPTIDGVDALSDVLRAVRLTGAYFYRVEAASPWSVAALPARELAPRVLPDCEHLISYHVVVKGGCWGGLVGEPQVRLEAGDAIVFPHGDAHYMSSAQGRRVPGDEQRATPARYPETLRMGSGPDQAEFVCGFLGCDARPFNPLLAALPGRLHVRGVTEGWLAEFPRQVVAESRLGRAGADTVLTRMAELMFIEVLRRHLETIDEGQEGWLAGLRDVVVGPAIACLHERPAHAWTLAGLAHEIGASRTVLAERFTRVVGVPPIQYLTQWRLQLAANQLAQGRAKVAAIAAEVGYDSEAAFSRAFKRLTGLSPSQYRRKAVPGGAALPAA